MKKAPNGRIYYFNKHTQKSVWEKPESLMTAGEKHLANCPWKSHKNTDGKTYFYNAVTKASSWQEPDELKKELVEYFLVRNDNILLYKHVCTVKVAQGLSFLI